MSWDSVLSGAGDFFGAATNKWLEYERIQHGADFNGSSQQAVNNTAEVPQQVNHDPSYQLPSVAGVPASYLLIGGLVLVGAVLIAKS